MPITCACGKMPCIILPGIGQSITAEYNSDGSIKRNVWPLEGFDTNRIVKKILPNALAAIITRQNSGLPKKMAAAVEDELDCMLNLPDGSPKHNIHAVPYPGSLAECSPAEKDYIYRMVPVPTLENHIGADHLWFFAYNSFGQTMDIVEELREYIQRVKAQTGHDKVNLAPVSLGGTIATAYLGKYGDDNDINRVVSIVPAYDGSQAVADALGGNLDYDGFGNAVELLFGSKAADQINKYLKLFSKKTAAAIVKALLGVVSDTVLKNSVTMWGIVPHEQYKSLSERLISDESHRLLKAQADEAYIYRRDFPKTVKKLQAQGVLFDDICCHGLRILEFCNSSKVDSDHIVHTHSASMGAYITPLGETLPGDYKQKGDNCSCGHNHISPCRTIDASVGLAPDTTWFFKGQAHDDVHKCRPVLEITEWLLADEEPKNVFSNERYPQFTVIK